MITLKKGTNGFVEINLEKSRAAPPNIIYLRMNNNGFDNIRSYLDLSKPICFPLYIHFSDDSIIKSWSYGKDFNYSIDKSVAINILLTKPITSLIYKIAKKSLQYYYKKYPSKNKSFVWSVFGKYLIENIKKNTLKNTNQTTIPFHDIDGDIEYLGARYREYRIDIEEGTDRDAKTAEV